EEEFATALAERLKLRNYDARAAFNAEDAMAVVLKDPPDVMVLDMKMPGISGVDIFKVVRQVSPTVEVIILSGHGSIQTLDKELEGEIFDYALKPVDFDDLRQKIDKAFEKHRRS
ncbi:MAG TPA: response regulator, partial [Dissulfurispiraceae bacterium]|nr:response regulator [Dissulfurispiraceae bacterium]